jgi:exonuclease SbcC
VQTLAIARDGKVTFVLITCVELENIKSYQKARITFPRGTIAISGANGAGKTTIVEAIGFALFDALTYKQAQFVRENERTGTVTVTFISDLDGREYQVVRRCGSNPAWYIYDPQMGQRLVEQKTDVLDWLRRHLRIEGELKLESLFTSALGVPQGTFTADFLLSPADRKQKFDTLLQVEDYRRAADKLLETRNHLSERIHSEELRIAGLTRDTQHLDTWHQELQQLRNEDRQKTDALLQDQITARQIESDCAALDRQQKEVAQLDNARNIAHAAWEAAAQIASQARQKLQEAEQAVQIAAATKEDYQRFNAAEAALREARRQQEVRRAIENQITAYRLELTQAKSEAASAEAQLQEAQRAAAEAAALVPHVAEQERLEAEMRRARTAHEKLHSVEATLVEADREMSQLQESLNRCNERIATITAQAAEAALLAERRQIVENLSQALAMRNERQRRIAAARKELQEVTNQETRAHHNVIKAEEYIAKIRADQPRVAELPALEARLRETQKAIATLNADIRRYEQSYQQSAGGQCPFLLEPCLNIRAKGQSSLEDYFTRLIAQARSELMPLEAQEANLAETARQCSQLKRDVDRLGEYEEVLAQRREELASATRRRTDLEAELADLEAWLGAHATIEQDLAAAREAFQRSDNADRQMRQLPGLESERQSILKGLEACKRRRDVAIADLQQLQMIAAQLPQIEAQLANLGDPRSRRSSLQGIADRAPIATQTLARARARQSHAEQLLRDAEAQLMPFAGLDERIAALEADMASCRHGHDTYLKCEQAAATYPVAKEEYARAQQAADQAHAAFVAAQAAWETAAANFDPAALQAASNQLRKLRDNISALTEAIRSLRIRIMERENAIAHAETLLVQLDAARRDRDRLVELRDALQFFRDTLKEAGPYVMRARLRQISSEANRIFGEIIGDRSVQLSWEEDYEIVLRQQGVTRHFVQLSGGEQMSAALAVRLALLKTLSGLDIAFFDEPTQNMDEQRRINLAAQIRRVRGFQQIIVISHDDTFEQGLDSIIRLRKENGQTCVETDELATASDQVPTPLFAAAPWMDRELSASEF